MRRFLGGVAIVSSVGLSACPNLDDLLARPPGSSTDASAEAGFPGDAAADGGSSGGAGSDPDLLAYWEFEGSGTTAEDLSGNRHAMTLAGGSTQGDGGRDGGGALVVHGFDQARAGSLDGSAFPRTGTIAFFLHYPVDGGIGNVFDGHDPSVAHLFVRRIASANGIQVALQAAGDAGYAFEATFGSTPAAWNHIAVTWDEEKAVASTYIDGVRFRTAAYAMPFAPEGQRVLVGKNLLGAVDGLRIYRRVLTEDEIAALAR